MLKCFAIEREEKEKIKDERRIGNWRRKGLGEGNWWIILKIPLETQVF
jgi:hypothetical protein